ncbi:MAG: tetratricopeptide repeat protein [Gammaproteobacteria bacterium]|nr:tetratricopeptide repeat protein [Gammaproteobacteria bacterium]
MNEHNNHANTLVAQGLVDHKAHNLIKARTFYEQALIIEPGHGDALHLLGMVADEEGDAKTAIQLLDAAIDSAPTVAIYHNNLGNIYFKAGNYELAEKYFSNATSINPQYIEAKFNLGNVFLANNDISSAQKLYQEIVSGNPHFVPALNNLVEIYLTEDNFSAAYECLKDNECVQQDIDLSIKYEEIMLIYAGRVEDDEKKIELLKNILKIDDQNLDVKFSLANLYKNTGNMEDAGSYYEEILNQDVAYFGAQVNYGVVDMWRGKFESARIKFEAAYRINSVDYVLLNNLGMVHQALKSVVESQRFYEKAIALNENKPEAYWNYSLLLLLKGEYELGWQYYEKRWDIAEQLLSEKRNYTCPAWSGESLERKTLFIYCEQGYGDSIQFFRYLIDLLEKNNHIVFECPEPLVRLFQHVHPKLKIVSPSDKFLDFDFHIAMMSLPLVHKTTLSDMPRTTPYLKTVTIDDEKWLNCMRARVDEKIRSDKNKKVGLVWAGNPRKHDLVNNMIDQRRSCKIEDLSSALSLNELEFYSLQKNGLGLESLMNGQIIDCMGEVEDFYDTACIIQNLDLVISVDTAVAHLAAALGKPVWLLSRYDGCWRWLLDREDSPWYPTVRLFRQSEPGDWNDVFDQVREALIELPDNN